MKIKINNPKAINHIGGRSNNEDSIFPLLGDANKNNRLFLVCDGVGGNEKGEVASRITCDSFAEYFEQNPTETSNETYIAEALKYAEANIDKDIAKNPDSKGMGTTLTLLHLHSSGTTIAHVGDSRVYQFRDGQIMFQTSDHSMVSDLLKAGVINEEQAKDHPHKNVISRAVQGASVKPTKADVTIITDIQPGDYFFLCSDGILENITDFQIGQILLQDIDDTAKMEQISKQCEIAPNDNFSAYLVPIQSVEGAILQNKQESTTVEATVLAEPEVMATPTDAEIEDESAIEYESPNKTSMIEKLISIVKKRYPLILILIGLPILIYLYGRDSKDESKLDSQTNKIGTQANNPTDDSTKNTDAEKKGNPNSDDEKENSISSTEPEKANKKVEELMPNTIEKPEAKDSEIEESKEQPSVNEKQISTDLDKEKIGETATVVSEDTDQTTEKNIKENTVEIPDSTKEKTPDKK